MPQEDMSDDVITAPEAVDLESILKRHKQENKDLINAHTALKHALNKNDKKGKKLLTARIATEEAELDLKHRKELETFNSHLSPSCTNDGDEIETSNNHTSKVSRAQKRRETKELLARNQDQMLAEFESQCASGKSAQERNSVEEILRHKKLSLVEIAADGDCMYNAIGHQLRTVCSKTLNCSELRLKVADYMRENRHDFEPYVENDFNEYCDNVEKTKMWGGELELKALSCVLHQPIVVIQANGTEISFGSEFESESTRRLVIAFLKHALSSGAHYDSTQSIAE